MSMISCSAMLASGFLFAFSDKSTFSNFGGLKAGPRNSFMKLQKGYKKVGAILANSSAYSTGMEASIFWANSNPFKIS